MTYLIQKAGVTVTSIGCENFDEGQKKLKLDNCHDNDVGVYTVTMTATLANLVNPATSLPWTTSNSFTVTIEHNCLYTVIDPSYNP